MANKKDLKLTKLQAEILELLNQGALISIDSMNMAKIGDRDISAQTRYFLTDNRLITRKDKSKSVTTAGNGFVISPKGASVLSTHKGDRK